MLPPRDRWPTAVLDDLAKSLPEAVARHENGKLKTTLPPGLILEEGRVLSIYGDSGWGVEVARGKYAAGRFSDELADAVATLVRDHWRPEPPPAWLAIVPSLRRPQLMQDFGGRVAKRLAIPFMPLTYKSVASHEQKEMESSAMQVRNLLGTFVIAGAVPDGPVLLMDDVVDSGWTLTLLGVMLRLRGSGPVYPLALAKASPRGR